MGIERGCQKSVMTLECGTFPLLLRERGYSDANPEAVSEPHKIVSVTLLHQCSSSATYHLAVEVAGWVMLRYVVSFWAV